LEGERTVGARPRTPVGTPARENAALFSSVLVERMNFCHTLKVKEFGRFAEDLAEGKFKFNLLREPSTTPKKEIS